MTINEDDTKILLEPVNFHRVDYLCNVAEKDGTPIYVQFSESMSIQPASPKEKALKKQKFLLSLYNGLE